ncbi:hypothetical protein BGW80DRAFT_570485 [Lactifluus volemus]|nr:hypothetical protein BGW80DRAFT_570485 [Lactifluus volemus]
MDSRLDSLSLPVVRASNHASDLDMGGQHDPSYPVELLIHQYFEWWSCRLHSRNHSHTPYVYTRQHRKTRKLRLFGGGDELRDSLGYSMTVLAWFIHGTESLYNLANTRWSQKPPDENGFLKDGDFIRDPNCSTCQISYTTSAASYGCRGRTVTSHYIPFTACVTDILDTTSLKLIIVLSICSLRYSNTSMKPSCTPPGRRAMPSLAIAAAADLIDGVLARLEKYPSEDALRGQSTIHEARVLAQGGAASAGVMQCRTPYAKQLARAPTSRVSLHA